MSLLEYAKQRLGCEIVNLILVSLLAVIASLQILIVTATVFHAVPIPPNPDYTFYRQFAETVKPEREIAFYRMFVLATIAFQVVLVVVFRKRFNDPALCSRLGSYVLAEIAALGVVFFVLFKMALYGEQGGLGKGLFIAGLVLVGLVDVLWWSGSGWLRAFVVWSGTERGKKFLSRTLDIGVPIFIVLSLYIPNHHLAMIKMLGPDKLLHFDSFSVAPGWAFTRGCKLNVDVWSLYGNGMPAVISHLSRWLGGFTYDNIIAVIVGMIAAYFIACYGLLRVWLKDAWVAAAGVLLAIRLQMFPHDPAKFFIITAPSSTVMRYSVDMIVLLFVLLFHRHRRQRYLWLAGAFTGFAVFYITDTGVYQLIAYYAYVTLLLLLPQFRGMLLKSRRDIVSVGLVMVLPLCVALALLGLCIGPELWKPLFRQNMSEYLKETVTGFGALPIYQSIQNRLFGPFFWGAGVGLTYLVTMVSVGTLCFLKKAQREHLFAVVVAIYGLCLYHYYVCRSAPVNYFAAGIPFVLLVCFWMKILLDRWDPVRGQGIRLTAFVLCLAGLFTTHSFLLYPNVWNVARFVPSEQRRIEDFEREFQEGFIARGDVDLITRFTRTEDKVCLVSSYETALLIAADRKPFFYNFDIAFSQPMNKRNYGGLNFFTEQRFRRMMTQMETERPPFVFIEAKVFLGKLALRDYERYATTTMLVQYLREHYVVVEQGTFLLALRRTS